jgi:adenylate cyclase
VRAVAGWSSNYVAKPGEAASRFRRAIRLSPLDTEMNYFLSGLAYAHLMTGEYEGALATALAAVRANPGRATPHRAVVAALVCMGRHEEAVAAAVRYKEAVPEGCFVAADRVRALFDDEQFAALMIGALRSVGIPE